MCASNLLLKLSFNANTLMFYTDAVFAMPETNLTESGEEKENERNEHR